MVASEVLFECGLEDTKKNPRKPHGNFMETLCLSCVLPGSCYQTSSSYDILWTVAFSGEASASGRNWLPNGCRMVAEAAKCLQFPMADSLGSWHLALGTDQEFSKTAFFAVLPTEEIRSVE